jgi:Amt family ammonium transporter
MSVRKVISLGPGVLLTALVIGAAAALLAPHGSKVQAACDPATETCPDRSGLNTGSGTDLADLAPGTLTPEDFDKAAKNEPFALKLADWVNQNRLGINFTWVLITGYLVMFMQAGFALVETGFARAKNAAHTMAMNFMVYPLGMLGFYICGFAFMFGGIGNAGISNLGGVANLNQELTIHIGGTDWGIIGHTGFFLSGHTYDVGIAVLFLFQMVFMDTTATIPTGAMCERWKWTAFLAYAPVISMIIYPVYGNWVWGGGWLSQLGSQGLGSGYLDFAGSGVVHAVGGWTALAGALVLGPRLGKYNKDGSSNAIPGHNLVFALLGTFILAFGWFGFNPGSTLGASGAGNLRIGVVAVNTMLASATGALMAMVYMWQTTKKPDPGMMANGMLAGLVAITAPSGFVSPIGACVIGAVAGVVVCVSVAVIDRVLHVDDPVGAISVHGVCGMWGQLALGIFADGSANFGGVTAKGLLFGDVGQFGAQAVGAGVAFVWAFGVAFLFFKVYHSLFGMRVSPEDELAGLDIPEMGSTGYAPDAEPYRGPAGYGAPAGSALGAPAPAPSGGA